MAIRMCTLISEANARWVKAKGRGPIQQDRATPNDESALLTQRMEDSSFRQVWRTTNMLLKLKRQAPGQEICEKSPASGYVLDKTDS
jgi:hypothetical protein